MSSINLKDTYNEFYEFELSRGKSKYQANKIAYNLAGAVAYDDYKKIIYNHALLDSFVKFNRKFDMYENKQKFEDVYYMKNLGMKAHCTMIMNNLKRTGYSPQSAKKISLNYVKYEMMDKTERKRLPKKELELYESIKGKYKTINPIRGFEH